MAKLSDLKLQYRIFMGAYRYRQFDWRPGAVLEKPLSQSRISVVTTAAFFLPEQAPFDPSIRGGAITRFVRYRSKPIWIHCRSPIKATLLITPALRVIRTWRCHLIYCAN